MPLALPIDVWVTVMVAVALPTAVSLWGVRRGAARINGGPFGKTERCLFAVMFVALVEFGQIDELVAGYLLQVLIWASMVTALLRWQRIRANR
jgi:CDP-diacylglycerol--glycerol-3-phosphate 3-phosphatidyltransferase